MSSMNHVIIMGKLTRDPQLRQTSTGKTVGNLGLAINETRKGNDGQPVESVCFVDIVVWGRQAETCAQFLKKGAGVLIEGRLQYDQWQTETGEKRNRLVVVAKRVQFIGRKTESESNPPQTNGNERQRYTQTRRPASAQRRYATAS